MTASDGVPEDVHGDELSDEAHALVEIFNQAKPDYSPEIEWFAMHSDVNGGQNFVFEAEEYIDTDGLDALRKSGREIDYIEGYAMDGVVYLNFEIPVQGELPTGINRNEEGDNE